MSLFGIFINQKLVCETDRGPVTFRVDSLGALYGSPLLVGVYQKRGISSLATSLLLPPRTHPAFDENLTLRKGNYFLDFALLAALLVSLYLAFLMGTNPRLSL